VSVSFATDHLQKKSRCAQERNPARRAAFQEQIAQIALDRLVFLDESGFHLAMYSAYGWSPQGQRLEEAIPFQKGTNFSVLGAMGLSGRVATFQKEGSIKRADLEGFLHEQLLPRLAPGAVLVLDNAHSHHGANLPALVAGAGCLLLYLPPYSPDLNPIELACAWIKRYVRRLAPRDTSARLAAIQSAIASLPQEFGEAWFRKTGLQY
jgi:transposase